jgi:hypothetical protein
MPAAFANEGQKKSAVIPSEFIYLLNPAHVDFSPAVQLGKEVDVFLIRAPFYPFLP